MNIQDGDKFLFKPKRNYGGMVPHMYVVHETTTWHSVQDAQVLMRVQFRLKEGIRDLGGGYTMKDVESWLKNDQWEVTYFPVVTKSVSEILDECQDI